MIDVVMVEHCSDPALTAPIASKFLAAVGTDNPLAITVISGGRLVLIPQPQNSGEAMLAVTTYLGQAELRVGISQFPLHTLISEPAQITPDIFEPCENLRLGTRLFAKVARIVTRWYGRPLNQELLPQMFDDAVHAWKTGLFEGSRVFQADDPGGPTFFQTKSKPPSMQDPAQDLQGDGQVDLHDGSHQKPTDEVNVPDRERNAPTPSQREVSAAPMRIDLSRIGE